MPTITTWSESLGRVFQNVSPLSYWLSSELRWPSQSKCQAATAAEVESTPISSITHQVRAKRSLMMWSAPKARRCQPKCIEAASDFESQTPPLPVGEGWGEGCGSPALHQFVNQLT